MKNTFKVPEDSLSDKKKKVIASGEGKRCHQRVTGKDGGYGEGSCASSLVTQMRWHGQKFWFCNVCLSVTALSAENHPEQGMCCG